MRQNCKIAPRGGDMSGMEKLYEHTLKHQEQKMREMEKKMESLEAALKETQGKAAPKAVPKAAPERKLTTTTSATSTTTIGTLNVDASVGKTVMTNANHISINIFGRENTAHITVADIWQIFKALGPTGEDLQRVAEKAILSTALMIFSDEKHPENITCYLPNKKGKEALVHGERGWQIQPISLALSPMASKSVDELFAKQPVQGAPGVEEDASTAKLDETGRILRYIADHEGDLVNAASSSELRAIPIRNKEILERVLARLPVAGDK